MTSFYEKYITYSDPKFLRLTGLKKDKFNELIPLFLNFVDKHWDKRGKKAEFTLVDKLLLTFRYLRDYPTFIVLGLEFGISESYTQKIFTKVSESLVKILKLPNLGDLGDVILERVIIDVSEQRTERPKKNKKKNIQVKPKLILIKP
jgi:hypothetical protein